VAHSNLLARERPEIVIVATPDHWHALPAVEAIKEGAHVLVASPLGHTVREGQAIKNAAAKASAQHRVVGAAAHWRYAPHVLSAREFLRSGKVGAIGFVRAFHYEAPQAELVAENEPEPRALAWDYWCGPAPKRHYNKLIYNDFSGFLDYGNGPLGREGTQWLDLVLWFMETVIEQRRERQGTTDGKREVLWPRRVFSTGGRPVLGPPVNLEVQDEAKPGTRARGRQTSDQPDNQVAVFDFGSAAVPFALVWQHRLFAANEAEKGGDSGCYFYGTEGTFHLGWQQGWTFYPLDKNKPPVACPAEEKPKDKTTHYLKELWEDFLGALAKETQPACGIEDAYRAATLTQLAMISLKSGRSIQWDGEQEIIVGDDFATSLLKRDYRPGYAHPSVS
jgi:predicted dehydrogenase